MELHKFRLSRLRNNEHMNFHKEFNDLVVKYSPGTLGVDPVYVPYVPFYVTETNAIDQLVKSTVTDELSEADEGRDLLLTGFGDTVKGAINHFDQLKREAAITVQNYLDRYRKIFRMNYDEETAAINSMLKELGENCIDELNTLALSDWLLQIQARNDAFDGLMKSRNEETSSWGELQMKQVRLDIDTAWKKIIRRLESNIDINGEERYKAFVAEFNELTDRFKNRLSIREGIRSKSKPDLNKES